MMIIEKEVVIKDTINTKHGVKLIIPYHNSDGGKAVRMEEERW